MNRILSDAVSFGRQYMRTKIGAFFTFIFPLLLIMLFGAVFSGGDVSGITLHVQNMDDGPYSLALMEALNSTGYFEIHMIPTSSDIQEYISDNSLSLATLIPSNFSEDIMAGTHIDVTLYIDQSKSSSQVAAGVFQAVISQLNYDLSGSESAIGFVTQNPGSDELTAYDFFLPGFVGLTVMITAMYFMTSTCAEYRSRGYFKLLATTRLRKSDWLISKFLFNSVLLIASLLLTFAVAMMVFDLNAVLTPMSIVLVIGGAFLFTSLGMLLGTVVKDPESGSAISNAIGFPMMFLSGSFWDLGSMPESLQWISKVMPLTYLNEGLRDTMVFGNEMGAMANFVIIVVMGAVFFILASRLMSWKER